jgi:hypothetical protein
MTSSSAPTENIKFKVLYGKQVFTPVSFAMCMLACTFPTAPSEETISTYQMWVGLCLRVLPIEGLKDLGEPTFRSRQQMFEFIQTIHFRVLHETLCIKDVLGLLSRLRANECRSEKPGVEAACVRNVAMDYPKSCCVVMFCKHGVSVPPNSFSIPSDVQLPPPNDDLDYEWTTDQAFCSCYFSVKWFLLHLVASSFPVEPTSHDRYMYHSFLTLFGKVLACYACRVNFQMNLELAQYHAQTTLRTNLTFVQFMYDLHNCVNKMLHKPQKVSLEETIHFFASLALITKDEDYTSHVYVVHEKDAPARFYIDTTTPAS